MGVMGLGENGLKVLGGWMWQSSPLSPPPNRIRGVMEHVHQDSTRPKNFLVAYTKP